MTQRRSTVTSGDLYDLLLLGIKKDSGGSVVSGTRKRATILMPPSSSEAIMLAFLLYPGKVPWRIAVRPCFDFSPLSLGDVKQILLLW